MIDNLIFEEMKSLESLDLSSNKLSSIPLSVGFCYKSLSSISLDKNPLNSDNFILWSQISSLKPFPYGNTQESKHNSRSSFDDYLSARLQGMVYICLFIGSPPKGFMIARKVYNRESGSHMRSCSSSTNSVSLSQRLLILRDIFDLYNHTHHDSAITLESESIKKKSPNLSKRNRIISEIISTEETYVNQLEILINIYVRPIRALEILPKEAYECLFSNVEGIYLLHKM